MYSMIVYLNFSTYLIIYFSLYLLKTYIKTNLLKIILNLFYLEFILKYFVYIYRDEPCSKVSVYNMKTALIEEMNKMVKQIVDNEQEVIKLNTSIEKKKLEIEKKKKKEDN